MRKKFILIFITMLISTFLFAATGGQETGGSGGNTGKLEVPDVSFSFIFSKPTRDVFGFCEPGNPGKDFVGTGGGLQFPLSEEAAPYTSSASIGVYYSLQGVCRLSVWCNADQRHTDTWRMRHLKEDGSPNMGEGVNGLNYTVTVTGTPSDSVPAAYASDQYPEVDLSDPTKPVYQVFHDGTGTKEGNATLNMVLTSPNKDEGGTVLPYMEGQYKGYIIMQYFAL